MTCFHFSFILLFPKWQIIFIIIFILSIINLWIWLFYDILILLMIAISSKITIFWMIFYTFYALCFCGIEEYITWTLFLIYDKWFHWLCIYKTLWPFGFETFVWFVADIILVAFWHYIILCFIGQVIIGSNLFRWRIKLFLFIHFNLIIINILHHCQLDISFTIIINHHNITLSLNQFILMLMLIMIMSLMTKSSITIIMMMTIILYH